MIVLAGASASGKTEVAKCLATKFHITKMITTTTRKMRNGEINGRDYFFIEKEAFLKMIEDKKFVEHTIYNDNYYGSTKDQIAPNRCIVIDPVGLKSYISLDNDDIVTFFLDSKEETRFNRMILRGDDIEIAKKRIIHDKVAFAKNNIPAVDYHIDSEEQTVEEVADQIKKLYDEEILKRHSSKK